MLFIASLSSNAQIEYPQTKKIPVTTDYFGTKVIDNYQWLEKIESPEVVKWTEDENVITKKYLKQLLKSLDTKDLMDKYMYESMSHYDGKISRQDFSNKYYFRIMYPGVNLPPEIFYKKGAVGGFDPLIRPRTISKKDLILFTYLKPSKNDNFLAYQYSRNGSDWKEIKIVQIKKRRFFKETIKHTKSSEIYWFGQGFFYKKYPFDSVTGKTIFPKIMYHKLATEQQHDSLVFEAKTKDEFLSLFGSEKEDFYIIKREDYNNKLFSYFYLDSYNKGLNFKPLLVDIRYDLDIIKYKNNTIFAEVTLNDKKHIISFSKEEPKKWKDLTPSYENAVLTDYEFLDKNLILAYQSYKNSIISMVDYDGNVVNALATPEGLTVKNLTKNSEYNTFFFTLNSYTVPGVLCKLNLDTFKYEIVGKTDVNFDPKHYKFSQRFFTSFDGTKVPIFIVFKDSLVTNKNTPFLLKTYGGYGIKSFPSFNPGIVYFIESGGAFAFVDVRGGGELGNKWWESGKRLNKKNLIDKNFI